jgi:hypothetical protein
MPGRREPGQRAHNQPSAPVHPPLYCDGDTLCRVVHPAIRVVEVRPCPFGDVLALRSAGLRIRRPVLRRLRAAVLAAVTAPERLS